MLRELKEVVRKLVEKPSAQEPPKLPVPQQQSQGSGTGMPSFPSSPKSIRVKGETHEENIDIQGSIIAGVIKIPEGSLTGLDAGGNLKIESTQSDININTPPIKPNTGNGPIVAVATGFQKPSQRVPPLSATIENVAKVREISVKDHREHNSIEGGVHLDALKITSNNPKIPSGAGLSAGGSLSYIDDQRKGKVTIEANLTPGEHELSALAGPAAAQATIKGSGHASTAASISETGGSADLGAHLHIIDFNDKEKQYEFTLLHSNVSLHCDGNQQKGKVEIDLSHNIETEILRANGPEGSGAFVVPKSELQGQ